VKSPVHSFDSVISLSFTAGNHPVKIGEFRIIAITMAVAVRAAVDRVRGSSDFCEISISFLWRELCTVPAGIAFTFNW
jgi:hypothetical protein